MDLEPFLKSVNDAAARSRTLWLGFIALLAYLFITVGAVTHLDLLMQSPVKLPVLNIDLPLVGFFVVAPVLFLINHFYLLLNLLGLSQRIKRFEEAIETAELSEEAESNERFQLDTFVVVQLLAGNRSNGTKTTQILLAIISWITIVIAPVTLLIFIQLQFLPYQNEMVTWFHRFALLTDLALIWRFWPSVRTGDWSNKTHPFAAWVAATIVLLFSFALATFPGEYIDGGAKAKNWSRQTDSYLWKLKAPIFGDLSNTGSTQARTSHPFLSRTLNIADERFLIDQAAFDKIRQRYRGHDPSDEITLDPWDERQKPWESERTRSFRERNLRGAVFDRTDLRNADFENASLQGASFQKTLLKGALLAEANLQRANLKAARLQEAALPKADLSGANLNFARLQGAVLASAKLDGATLVAARLQGSTLVMASLQGASLDYARLHAASLIRADLRAASLINASLDASDLKAFRIEDAVLDYASLRGAEIGPVSISSIIENLGKVMSEEARHILKTDFDAGKTFSAPPWLGVSLVETKLWRLRGEVNLSAPHSTVVELTWPQTLSIGEFTEIQKSAREGVVDKITRSIIDKRLSLICDRSNSCQKIVTTPKIKSSLDALKQQFDKEKFIEEKLIRLQEIACNEDKSRFIAEKIIERISDIDQEEHKQYKDQINNTMIEITKCI